jgi:predicted transcriptional regulator
MARIPDELAVRLDEYAAQRRWSRAIAIQALIEQALEQEKELR